MSYELFIIICNRILFILPIHESNALIKCNNYCYMIRPKKFIICFSGTFFEKMMREGGFLFFTFLTFANKIDVLTMFQENS